MSPAALSPAQIAEVGMLFRWNRGYKEKTKLVVSVEGKTRAMPRGRVTYVRVRDDGARGTIGYCALDYFSEVADVIPQPEPVCVVDISRCPALIEDLSQ